MIRIILSDAPSESGILPTWYQHVHHDMSEPCTYGLQTILKVRTMLRNVCTYHEMYIHVCTCYIQLWKIINMYHLEHLFLVYAWYMYGIYHKYGVLIHMYGICMVYTWYILGYTIHMFYSGYTMYIQGYTDSIRLTADGVVPLDLTCPSSREALLGPAGAAYTRSGIIVATGRLA